MKLFTFKIKLSDARCTLAALIILVTVLLAATVTSVCFSAPIGYSQIKSLSGTRAHALKNRSADYQWNNIPTVIAGNILFIKSFEGDNNTYFGTALGKLYKKDSQGVIDVVPVTEGEFSSTLSGYNDMAVHNGSTYVATLQGLYRSRDNLESWQKVRSTDFEDSEIYTIVSHQNTILVATAKGVFRSDDEIFWHKTTIGSGEQPVHFITSNGSTLLTFFGKEEVPAILISDDSGKTWFPVTLPPSYTVFYAARSPFTSANGRFYAGAWYLEKDQKGNEQVIPVFLESSDGRNWSQIKDPIMSSNINQVYMDIVAVDGNGVIYGVEQANNPLINMEDYNIYASFSGQDSWQSIAKSKYDVSTMNIVRGDLMIAQAPIGRFGTYDSNARDWIPGEGVPSASVFSASHTNENAYILANAAGLYNASSYFDFQLGSLLYIAYSGGNWILGKNPESLGGANYVDISGESELVVTIDEVGIVRYSNDGGFTFKDIKKELVGPYRTKEAVTFYNGSVYGATGQGIFRSSDFINWTQVNPKEPTYIIVRKFLNVNKAVYAAAQLGGVLKSTNGQDWSLYNEGFARNKTDIRTLTYDSDTLFAGGSSLYVRKDGASQWTDIGGELGELTGASYINGIAVKGDRLFITVNQHGVFMGFINGTGWQPLNNGLPTLRGTVIFRLGSSDLVLGTEDAGMFNMTAP